MEKNANNKPNNKSNNKPNNAENCDKKNKVDPMTPHIK